MLCIIIWSISSDNEEVVIEAQNGQNVLEAAVLSFVQTEVSIFAVKPSKLFTRTRSAAETTNDCNIKEIRIIIVRHREKNSGYCNINNDEQQHP